VSETRALEKNLKRIRCKLISHSNSLHLQQIYTGFFLLSKAGIIDLKQVTQKINLIDNSKAPHLRNSRFAHLSVIVNDKVKLHYDTHDSWEIDEEYLAEADHYFKRSILPNQLQFSEKSYKKIHPLGLNYLVYPNGFDLFHLRRILTLLNTDELREAIRSFGFIPSVDKMWSSPDFDLEPKVLFMAKAYDPYDISIQTKDKREERIQINETRINCIKLLKKELGSSFHGGLIPTRYALTNYKDFLISHSNLSLKKNYLELLQAFPICVATTGLHGSIGWKFAEYVAFSKAIVSEKLNYETPGDIRKNENYLEFTTPEECAQQALNLISNRDLRNQLMTNNANYYSSYLKPDALVLNTITTALSGL
jgi:hypothetical protein